MPLGGDGTPCLRCYPGVSSPGLVGRAGYEPAIIQRHGRWISPMCGGNPRTRRALLVRQYRLFQASRSAAYWLPKERDYCCFLTTLPFGWRSMTYPRGSNPHHAIKPLRRVTAIWLLTRLRQPELVGPAGVEPASAGFLFSRAQTVRPMKCPSVRAAKRLSALSHIGRRVSPSQGGTDNRHVDQTRRGGKGWGRPSEPFSAADAEHLPARGHHARSKGMTSTFPRSIGSGRRRVSSHAVSWGSSSSGVFRRTTA